jgi:two-component system nitrate/nitrite response regulator NarL
VKGYEPFIFIWQGNPKLRRNAVARIIVADDHELVRKGIKAALDGHPHLKVCGMAENGQEAIDKVLEHKPDLVILDLSMPILNGFQAALKIRHLAPAVKILILSIHDAHVVEQVSYLMGADAYLQKTATAQELLSTISSILDGNLRPMPDRAGLTAS